MKRCKEVLTGEEVFRADLAGTREQLRLRRDRDSALLCQQARPPLLRGEVSVVRRRVRRQRQPHAGAAAPTRRAAVPGDHVEPHEHERRRRRRLQRVHAHDAEDLVQLEGRVGRVKGEPPAEIRAKV